MFSSPMEVVNGTFEFNKIREPISNTGHHSLAKLILKHCKNLWLKVELSIIKTYKSSLVSFILTTLDPSAPLSEYILPFITYHIQYYCHPHQGYHHCSSTLSKYSLFGYFDFTLPSTSLAPYSLSPLFMQQPEWFTWDTNLIISLTPKLPWPQQTQNKTQTSYC